MASERPDPPHPPRLEEVFKLSGVPTYTFVKPREFERLVISIRTPGRGVVVEGPSGIGKTTAVVNAIAEVQQGEGIPSVRFLSGRRPADLPAIEQLPFERGHGIAIIDDFHRLPDSTRGALADHLKVLADEESPDSKCVILGINKTGESLVRFAPDVASRIDVIRFETNSTDKVQELVELGETALNIRILARDRIFSDAAGSFHIAQLLSHEACLLTGVRERCASYTEVASSYPVIQNSVYGRLSAKFNPLASVFAAGPKLHREGRAPYLHILRWLAESHDWSIDLDHEIAVHREQRESVGQIVNKQYLDHFLEEHHELDLVLHYDRRGRILSVEDPQFVYFLRNIPWNRFARDVGYIGVSFPGQYDFALSFAHPERSLARALFEKLQEMEFAVFFDENEQHRMLAKDVEEYLAPIYRSEATYVVCLLGTEYPTRLWTKFESAQFRERFSQGEVVPVWILPAGPSAFDTARNVGHYTIDPLGNVPERLTWLADLLRVKILEKRTTPPAAVAALPAPGEVSR